jgi:formylglycine-generating enzyme required for sulfatase activity
MVLYPRFWKKPPGARQEGGFVGNQVPWDQQPVYGITLYEALAYVAWLRQVTGLDLTLPDEAEYERAAGWPLEALQRGDGPMVLDPRRKVILPWHTPGGKKFHDFNNFFGQEGRDMETFYFFNKREYQTLLAETAKRAPDGQDIFQLVGFGWQWTCDRYDPVEHKYNRFHPDTYPLCETVAARTEQSPDLVPIYQYKPNSNMSHSHFVVRGSPDVVGGPGIVTRRFSIYPMRGYRNVGFRFVFRQG